MRLDSFAKRTGLCLVFLIANSSLFAQWGTYIEVTRIEDQYTFKGHQARVDTALRDFEMAAFEIEAKFNIEENFNSKIYLKVLESTEPVDGSPVFQNWIDQEDVYPAGGERDDLKRVLYLRPQLGVDSPVHATFVVQSGWGELEDDGTLKPGGKGSISKYVFDITILPEEQYAVVGGTNIPLAKAIVDPENIEPQYTAGTSNDIVWEPAQWTDTPDVQLLTQDVYVYDSNDMAELIPAVQGLYKRNLQGIQETWFQGLEDGHTYGYVVKTLYVAGPDTISQYSNAVLSTQDNSPPLGVLAPIANNNNGQIEVTWNPVQDAVSGIDYYAIFRAEDTQPATLIDTVRANTARSRYQWIDTDFNPASYETEQFHYVVRAVDKVGNMGSGERSDFVEITSGSGSGTGTDLPVDDTGTSLSGTAFVRGSIDTTLTRILDNQLAAIRFQVSREDPLFEESNAGFNQRRFFDSGWISREEIVGDTLYLAPEVPEKNLIRYRQGFDYGEGIENNFVNGHLYYRRAMIRYQSGLSDTVALDSVIPDCFPPNDVRNVIGETVLDPDSPETAWHVRLSWQPTSDPVSGVLQYHIHRSIQNADFVQVYSLPQSTDLMEWTDSISENELPRDLLNPTVKYRIVAEDYAGNQTSVEAADWEVEEIALAAPIIRFADLRAGQDTLRSGDVTTADILYTRQNQIVLLVKQFDVDKVTDYEVRINGASKIHDKVNAAKDSLFIDLPMENDTLAVEISEIEVRAVYSGQRYSLYSDTLTLVRTRNQAPDVFTVSNKSDSAYYWGGNLYLNWDRPSVDAAGYEIWRSEDQENFKLAGTSDDLSENVQWTDFYDRDEIDTTKADQFTVYQNYFYKIRKQNVFDDWTDFSEVKAAYCNKPPVIVSHDSVKTDSSDQSKIMMTIHWTRTMPNLAADSWGTRIRIYQDSLKSKADDTETLNNSQTSYTYRNAEPGHNYIFRIQENPGGNLSGLKSAWSEPYTVEIEKLTPMYLIPQPKGGMYVRWENAKMMEALQVDSIVVLVQQNNAAVCQKKFPAATIDWMTEPGVLEHGKVYTYTVQAIDSLRQVVASNALSDTCDYGMVYVPELRKMPRKYYSGDSVTVDWYWNFVNGEEADSTTRGAVKAQIKTSISRDFAENSTVTTEWFEVNPDLLQKTVAIPQNRSSANDTLYFKITGCDTFANNIDQQGRVIEWSACEKAVFDPEPPRSVTDLTIESAIADSMRSDTLCIDLSWTGRGVEVPVDDSAALTVKTRNIHSYQIYRYTEGDSAFIAEILVDTDICTYQFEDKAVNRAHQWKIMSVDSAGLKMLSDPIAVPVFLQTPESLTPTGFKACTTTAYSTEGDSIEYAYEIAVDPTHYQIAYGMYDENSIDRLLSRSGWTDSLTYHGPKEWGAVIQDTTWFRMKVRQKAAGQYWESAWSTLRTWPNDGPGTPKAGVETIVVREFQVLPNYPNPFNGETQIVFQIPEPSDVQVVLYNIKGETICVLQNGDMPAGQHQVSWTGRNQRGLSVASGIYFLHVTAEHKGSVFRKKMKVTYIK